MTGEDDNRFEFLRATINIGGLVIVAGMIVVIIATIVAGN
jgi:hypothetical protein